MPILTCLLKLFFIASILEFYLSLPNPGEGEAPNQDLPEDSDETKSLPPLLTFYSTCTIFLFNFLISSLLLQDVVKARNLNFVYNELGFQ